MKIVVAGTRGIPDIQGGVETHCEHLYPRLVQMGHDVTVIRRSPYIPTGQNLTEYQGVKLCDVYAPRRKSLEAIVHTFLAIVKARQLKADVIHIHAIGPGIMTPFARLMGLKVVTTNHGPDYDRDKWGRLAKAVLRLGECAAARFSNRVIVISNVISDILKRKYGRSDTILIFNGVNSPQKTANTDYLQHLGLQPGNYIIGLARLVPEKGFHDLIEAYRKLGRTDVKLVIAGDADHEDEYSRNLKTMAADTPGVVMTGFIKGEKLNQLMSHAMLFAMPSYHEGLPIALLEAMSYGLDVAVSDIPANKLSCLSSSDFFAVGNVDDLVRLLENKINAPLTPRSYDLSPYNWDEIARQTNQVYQSLK